MEKKDWELTGLKVRFDEGRSVVITTTPGENTYI